MKNRTTVRSSFDKLQHTQRQEAAQQRKEEKVRAQKEKTMQLSETDPEKARKMEVSEELHTKLQITPFLLSYFVMCYDFLTHLPAYALYSCDHSVGASPIITKKNYPITF